MRRAPLVSLVLFLGLAIIGTAQPKSRLTPADYGQWETLGATSLSPDGKWLAYSVNRSNRNNELRIVGIANGAGGEPKVVAFGAQPVFSSDARWVAYSIGYSEAQEEKLRKDRKPIHRKLGLLNLANGEQTVVDGIESFSFSANGVYLAMRRYVPERAGAPPAEPTAEPDAAPGATLIVRQLASGRDTSFGNVAEYVWQDLPRRGRLLALTISAEDKTGNGVQLFDPDTSVLRVLDSAATAYSGLTWRKESGDLAVLRAKMNEKREGATNILLAWQRLGEAGEAKQTYDPTADAKFPAGMRAVAFRRPSWSQDGGIVFFGIAKWAEKPTSEKKSAESKDAPKEAPPKEAPPKEAPPKEAPPKEAPKEEDEPAGVDVWHARDVIVMPKQKIDAGQDRRRNFLAAWHLDGGRFVQLGQSHDELVVPLKYQKLGVVRNWASYAMERTIGRPAADLSLIDLMTGERAKIKDRLSDDFYVQPSPGGRYLLFSGRSILDGQHCHARRREHHEERADFVCGS
jgi:hypothetical protein